MTASATIRKRRETQPLSQISEADCVALSVEPSETEIRERAYVIYLARMGAPGDPAADWYQAQRELRAQQRAAHTTE